MNSLLSQAAAAEPEAFKWLQAHAGNEFADSLVSYASKRGYLSPGQLAAVLRNVERDKTPAPDVDTTRLEAVFVTASSKGLKKPALQIGQYRFSPAPATGANPGAIYVKEEGTYLGKMLNGKFLARATQAATAEVLAIAADPLGEAIKNGKLTGRCAICSRKLSDPESVDRGIGPICQEKFFGY